MVENKKINADAIQECIDKWEVILCSISSAKRNGKVTNRKTWVRRDNPEKCINSFLEKHKEKLTNFELGFVDMKGFKAKENEPNMVTLTEMVSDGTMGEVKFFVPELIDDVWVYKLFREENLLLKK